MSKNAESEHLRKSSFNASVAVEIKIGDSAWTDLQLIRFYSNSMEDAVKDVVSIFRGKNITSITLVHVFFNTIRFYDRDAIRDII